MNRSLGERRRLGMNRQPIVYRLSRMCTHHVLGGLGGYYPQDARVPVAVREPSSVIATYPTIETSLVRVP